MSNKRFTASVLTLLVIVLLANFANLSRFRISSDLIAGIVVIFLMLSILSRGNARLPLPGKDDKDQG